MFWKRKKKEKVAPGARPGDAARVAELRARLSEHVSTGEKTNFDIPRPTETVDDDGTIEFTLTDIATVNYNVTEWDDITEADTDVRNAIKLMKEAGQSDYWKDR